MSVILFHFLIDLLRRYLLLLEVYNPLTGMESETLYFDLAKGKGAAEEDEPALAPEETADSWHFSW